MLRASRVAQMDVINLYFTSEDVFFYKSCKNKLLRFVQKQDRKIVKHYGRQLMRGKMVKKRGDKEGAQTTPSHAEEAKVCASRLQLKFGSGGVVAFL
jgi:hypothetical protein